MNPVQTASEPLTLEQEYEMQQSWFEDEDKCTFIMLDAAATSVDETTRMAGVWVVYISSHALPLSQTTSRPVLSRDSHATRTQLNQSPRLCTALGDVNLFFNDADDKHAAEIEVMVADPKLRGRGFGA